ncbi:MAG: hypothetical protein QOJ68_3741 [Blastococcus sp.]|nr:hypothetical protein [Blastococcus sp.]
MPYSLVSAATLGFDLVRLPAGRSVADVLLTGLGAHAGSLSALAAAHPGRSLDRDERLTRAVRSRKARELAAVVPQVRQVAAGVAAGERAALLVAQLETGTIGDAATIERLVRDDVLGPEHVARGFLLDDELDESSDVLADAAVGYWAAGVLPPLVRRDLTAPFDRVLERGTVEIPPVGADLGPAADELAVFLDSLSAIDAAGRDRWRRIVDEGRAQQRSWAAAMHEASWAAHVSGRLRAVAAAQLHAVRAFVDAGFGVHDGAAGVWNAVAGCVQGIALQDLVDEASLAVLIAPLPGR